MEKQLIAKVNYFDIKVGDKLDIVEFVKTDKNSCDYYKTVVSSQDNSNTKIHYMFTSEVDSFDKE